VGSTITGNVIEIRAEHVVVDTVRLESNMEARSARIACEFYRMSLEDGSPFELTHCRPECKTPRIEEKRVLTKLRPSATSRTD
jgi:hypothetical protein